jgi:hypothetical protein
LVKREAAALPTTTDFLVCDDRKDPRRGRKEFQKEVTRDTWTKVATKTRWSRWFGGEVLVVITLSAFFVRDAVPVVVASLVLYWGMPVKAVIQDETYLFCYYRYYQRQE